MRRGFIAGAAVAAILATAGAAQADVRVEKVGDFTRPVYVAGAPGDGGRLYVVEQRGTVQVLEDGAVRPFLDLRDAVRGPDDPEAGSEEGMTSIAFPPDFHATRRFYVYYTVADGLYNRVDELRVGPDGTPDPASRRLVIAIPHVEGSHHNGGQLQFGGDLLYLAPGDGGTGGAPARDLSSLLGKLLRIDPRGAGHGDYTVPAGNPYVGQPGRRPEIWASGLRNPFRFSFDRLTGDLVLGDVGEKTAEEIDFLPAASGRGRGADLGWGVCEGTFRRGTTDPCPLTGSVAPALQLTRADGYRSVIAGYVVRDPSLPSLYGRLVYGDFYVDRLRSVRLGPAGATEDGEVGPQAVVPRLTSFGEDAGGCVYATSIGGAVYRVVENDASVPCAAGVPRAPEDTRAPAPRAELAAWQRVAARGTAVIRVRCDEACRATVAGRVAVGKRRYALRTAGRSLRAGQSVRVALPLTRAARRALRRAPRRRAARLTVTLRVRDAMGNAAPPVTRTARVQR